MQKHHLVTLTPDQRQEIDTLVHRRATDALTRRHGRILLLCDTCLDGGHRTDVEIAHEVRCTARQVARIRSLFATEGLERALYRQALTRTTPRKLDPVQETRVIELMLEPVPAGNRHWSLSLLRREIIARGIVASVSKETVRQTLKRGAALPIASATG
ncbi:MAG TPA: helix-turn-helix domain-containing protein [Thermomicrobiales bacterium]|nr:helix-turn-helix domain-containing protein [Thermomicrobiales bacterium]